jgi:hypothetical protein
MENQGRDIKDMRLVSVGTVSAVSLGGGGGTLEGLEDVVGEILSVLNTAADANKVVEDTNSLTLISRNTGVSHAAGNLDQTLDSTETLGESEDLGHLAEALSSGVAALDAEREHTTTKAVAVLLLSDVSVRVGVKARVVDSNDQRRGLESSSHGIGVAAGLTSSQMQSLETTVSKPRVKGRRNSANGVLEEAETGLELVAVESSNTHDYIAVTVDVLGDTVNDDIGAEVEGVLDVGREESVVNNDENTMLVGLRNDSSDIDEA